MTAPRALVTGASGFVGGHLARRLVAEGWDVHALVRPSSGATPEGARRHVHDGSTASMHSLVAAARPEVVFHVASLVVVQHRPEDVAPLVEANVLLGAQLCDAMAAAGVKRLVHAATSWQHYQDADYQPVNLYAATKQAFADLARYYAEARGLTAVALELFDTYGPGDPRPKLVNLLARAAREGTPLSLSPGEQVLDLVHVDDVAEAFLGAARVDTQEPAPAFALTSGARLTLRELVALFSRVAGRELPVTFGARPYREREVMTPWSRGRPLPGWHARVSLEDGLRALLRAAS